MSTFSVPTGTPSRYASPRSTIDPDRSKSWVRRAAPIVLAHKVEFYCALIFSFLGLVIQVSIPLIIQNGITDALLEKTRPLHLYVALLAGLALCTGVFGYISRANQFKLTYAIEFDLRNILYEHFSRLSFPFYDRVQSGQLISRANSDIRSVQVYLTFAPMIAVQCSMALVAFCFMLTISVPLAFVAMASMPFIWLVGLRMRKLLYPVSWLIQSRLAEVATVVDENVNGVRVVRGFAGEQQQLRQLASAAERVQWAYVKDADAAGPVHAAAPESLAGRSGARSPRRWLDGDPRPPTRGLDRLVQPLARDDADPLHDAGDDGDDGPARLGVGPAHLRAARRAAHGGRAA